MVILENLGQALQTCYPGISKSPSCRGAYIQFNLSRFKVLTSSWYGGLKNKVSIQISSPSPICGSKLIDKQASHRDFIPEIRDYKFLLQLILLIQELCFQALEGSRRGFWELQLPSPEAPRYALQQSRL
ncbi:hypothetical protein TNCV_645451 [Trichonephila clavipes]|nr:hypothetical protein TNCV_645451 [Trichonephila clavipes]